MFKKVLFLTLSCVLIIPLVIVAGISLSPSPTNQQSQLTPTPSSIKTSVLTKNTKSIETRIEVDKKSKTLTLYIDDKPEKQYKIAIGKPSTPTPAGSYKVIEKAVKPAWLSPSGKIIKGSSPNNPIAERWMRLGRIKDDGSIKRTGIGIHGTIVPSSIGTSASGGCIRMYKKDVIELYPKINIDTIVVIK